ncbi:MAG: nucleotidyltransferase domain-containing protein [Chitinispirillales bacterium]|nr:nucleotidyltransferase domain-containing protein [Chitinispirillales bacterium]
MTETVKKELDKIVSTLVETGIVTKIILFGSHARGEENADSDIDLCVLTSEKDKRPVTLMQDFRRKLCRIKTMPLDLLAFNQDAFYSNAVRPTSFEHEIVENGVLIYDR